MPSKAALLGTLLLATCARRTAASDPVVEKGRHLYTQYCATCHGLAAAGYAADNAPSLRSPTFAASVSDAFLRAAIIRGRPGTSMGAYGKALSGPLEALDVDAVVAFLREGGPPPAALPTGPVTGDVARGEQVYKTSCLACHGTSSQRGNAVHLANPVFLETAGDQFLRWAVVAGRPPTAMLPWKDLLRPKEIDDVIAYVRSLARPAGMPPPPAPAGVAGVTAASSAPRKGPVVIHPQGRAPNFTLKEDLYVSIDQVKQAFDQKRRLVIADARPPGDWTNLHITGSISAPYYDAKAVDDIPNDGTWVLAYCGCPHHLSGELVDHLRKLGYRHTAVIDEGIFAWQTKGYPVVIAPGAPKPPAPPPAAPTAVPAHAAPTLPGSSTAGKAPAPPPGP